MQNNAVDVNNVSFPYTHQADPDWIAAAYAAGLRGNTISREDAIKVRETTLLKLPRWLMKDPTRRISRGVYACPELELFAQRT